MTPLGPTERAIEALLMGLRLTEGVDCARLTALASRSIDDLVDPAAARRLAAAGLLTYDRRRLGVTAAGMLLLDAILAKLVVA